MKVPTLLLLICSSLMHATDGLKGRKSFDDMVRSRVLKSSSSNNNGDACTGGAAICDICTEIDTKRPENITLMYLPIGPTDSIYQDIGKASCDSSKSYPLTDTITVETNSGEQTFPVSNGTIFTVYGEFGDAELDFAFTQGSSADCFMHISCSVPIVPGDRIGAFVVIGDYVTCGQEEKSCEECTICTKENKCDFKNLTFTYLSDGKDSEYQVDGTASCMEGTYPDSTTLHVYDKESDTFESFDVTDGDKFTIQSDDFAATTEFCFDLNNDGTECVEGCFIHTSCSVPIVVGDQIGPFRVEGGGICDVCDPVTESPVSSTISTVPSTPVPTTFPPTMKPTVPPGQVPGGTNCVVPDKVQYCQNDPITVAFDYSDPLPDDWIGIYPCNVPFFLHAVVWQWNCGFGGCARTTPASETGTTVFDGLPAYNIYGPHTWPVPLGCHRAVYLRNDGPSVPPYIEVCESNSFEIVDCSTP